MKTGVVFPQTEIGRDPLAIRDFAQAVEEMGFDHLVAYDHVVGADISNRPGWSMPYTHESAFHEPLVLFSYLAGVTTRLEFATGVVIMPQRQAALFAKQAANLDIFCQGRLRLGLGIGWNEVEYEALGIPFEQRGSRLDEQVEFMRRLWCDASFSFDGRFHQLSAGGINPLPDQRPIPVWIGGVSEKAMRRAAKFGDGWMPVLPAAQADEQVGRFRELVQEAGRDPSRIGFENIIFIGRTIGGPRRGWEDAVADHAAWKQAGATHVCVHTMGADLTSPDEHLELLRRIIESVAD